MNNNKRESSEYIIMMIHCPFSRTARMHCLKAWIMRYEISTEHAN